MPALAIAGTSSASGFRRLELKPGISILSGVTKRKAKRERTAQPIPRRNYRHFSSLRAFLMQIRLRSLSHARAHRSRRPADSARFECAGSRPSTGFGRSRMRRASANCCARSMKPTRNCSALARGSTRIRAARSGRAAGRRCRPRSSACRPVLGMALERRAHKLDLAVGQMLDADEWLARLVDRAQQLVELGLHRRAVAVLAVLDQEHQQEGHDGRSRC